MNETAETAPVGQSAPPGVGRERWVEDYGDFLYAFAMLRLRDPHKAQDAVQETFLAALKSETGCSGKSTERAWLAGILKHKIYDYYRKAARETSFTELSVFADGEEQQFVQEGRHKNSWVPQQAPAEWPNAGEISDREEFWRTFHKCATKLPANVSRVFLLRELDGMETKEICSLLDVTENNVWVMLHRARMALRRCLEKNWFTK